MHVFRISIFHVILRGAMLVVKNPILHNINYNSKMNYNQPLFKIAISYKVF